MSGHDHHMMDHSMHHGMDHGSMDHGSMDHGSMDHGSMDHAAMDHTSIDHSQHMMHMGHSMDMSMNNSSGHSMMHMMMMYFHFGYNETVLFNFWTISSVNGLLVSMIGIFFMSALYEGIKYYREYLFWKTYNALQYRSVDHPANNKNNTPQDNTVAQPTILSKDHFWQTLLHLVQIVLSYMLMLIFMTYNVWLCMAVALGATTGYFIFGWKKSVFIDVTDHCH